MPQEFHVLQCSRCRTFQVQQVKKAKKWACKMCGEKQSVLRVYGRGTGAECRQHVQKLNSLRGELEGKKEHLVSATRVEENADHLDNFQIEECEVERNIQQRPPTQGSKWSQYIEPASPNQMDDDDDDDGRFTTDRGRYNTSINQQRKEKRKACKQKAQNLQHMDQTTNDKASKSDAGNFQPMMSQGSSIKRPPENCLSTRAAKRTKWTKYEDYDENCENLDQPQIIPTAFFEPQISTNQQSRVIVTDNHRSTANVTANHRSTANVSANQQSKANVSANQRSGPILTTNPKALTHKTLEHTIPHANFTLCDIDEFLEDTDEVKQKENSSASQISEKFMDNKITKRSKWDVYLSQSSEEEPLQDSECDDPNLLDIHAVDKFPYDFEQNKTQASRKTCSKSSTDLTEINQTSSACRDSSNINFSNICEKKKILLESSCDSEMLSQSSNVPVESDVCFYDCSSVNSVDQSKDDSEVISGQYLKDKKVPESKQVFKSASPTEKRISRPVFEMEDLDDSDFEFSVY